MLCWIRTSERSGSSKLLDSADGGHGPQEGGQRTEVWSNLMEAAGAIHPMPHELQLQMKLSATAWKPDCASNVFTTEEKYTAGRLAPLNRVMRSYERFLASALIDSRCCVKSRDTAFQRGFRTGFVIFPKSVLVRRQSRELHTPMIHSKKKSVYLNVLGKCLMRSPLWFVDVKKM